MLVEIVDFPCHKKKKDILYWIELLVQKFKQLIRINTFT